MEEHESLDITTRKQWGKLSKAQQAAILKEHQKYRNAMKPHVRALGQGSMDDYQQDGQEKDGATNEAPPAAAGLAFGGRALVCRNKKKK